MVLSSQLSIIEIIYRMMITGRALLLRFIPKMCSVNFFFQTNKSPFLKVSFFKEGVGGEAFGSFNPIFFNDDHDLTPGPSTR